MPTETVKGQAKTTSVLPIARASEGLAAAAAEDPASVVWRVYGLRKQQRSGEIWAGWVLLPVGVTKANPVLFSMYKIAWAGTIRNNEIGTGRRVFYFHIY